MNAVWQAYYRDRAEAEKRRRFPATGEDISTLDFAYTIAGCGRCAWRPQRVYKNGKLTVLQLGPGIHQGDVPALLVQSTQGEALVNYRIHGKHEFRKKKYRNQLHEKKIELFFLLLSSVLVE